MQSPYFQEVKVVGMGQGWSGVNPSGPAFMYQAQATPAPVVPPAPTPDQAAPVVPPAPPMPTTTVPPGQTPALPASPAKAQTTMANSTYVAAGIAFLALVGACLIPSRK